MISALGGSRTQIGGPTGAFVVVVSGIVATYGMDGLYMCTMMAGVLLVILGITGLGSAVKFIPRAVVIGFTNGIALLIASTQIKDLTALDSTGLHALESIVDQLQESGRRVLFCGMREQPLALMRQAHFEEHLEPGDFCKNVHIALDRAQQIIAENIRRRRPRAA